MKTLGEVLKLSADYLSSRRDAEDLLCSVLKLKRVELYMQFDRPLQESELTAYRAYLKRRREGEPVEYILGEVEFFKTTLQITRSVLIPRPETEILLDKVCKEIDSLGLKEGVVWDVCTGSGCLGIGLKKRFPHLTVVLSDLSREALEVAKANAQRNGVEVEALQGDLLSPFQGKKADIILCNPPYISEGEYALLGKEVKAFEPKLALVSGVSGLEYYERLASELPLHLKPGGKVFFEIGTGQGRQVLNLFYKEYWKLKKVEKDWAGHDRFFFLEFE